MRSVVVHVQGCAEAELESALCELYPGQEDPWLDMVDGDPCLYIRILQPDEAGRWVAEERAPALRHFGEVRPLTVVADVSGRHDGTSRVRALAVALLSRFEGIATDEYSDRLWSLDEILRDASVEGHRFFDFKHPNGTSGPR